MTCRRAYCAGGGVMSDRLVTAAAEVIVDANLRRRVRRGDWNTGEVTLPAAEEYAQALANAGYLKDPKEDA